MIQAACASAGGGLVLSGSKNINTRAVGSSPPDPSRKAPRANDVLLLLLLLLMEVIMP
jgi:hypothetical protein